MADVKTIGHRLRSLREGHGETAADLANVLGCSQATIYHYEKGRALPSVLDLEKIADHYGVPISYFLGREGGEPAKEDRLEGRLWQVARETEKLRREVEELTGDMARLVWIPIRGTAPGGYPDFREEVDLGEHFPVPKGLIRDPQKAFAVRVTGNSMNGRGVLDGDVVIVDMTLEPNVGDIVVVRKDDEAVLRIYNRDHTGPYQDAANERYKRLRLKEGQIVGVVVYSGREHRRQ